MESRDGGKMGDKRHCIVWKNRDAVLESGQRLTFELVSWELFEAINWIKLSLPTSSF